MEMKSLCLVKNVIDGQKNCGGTTWTFSHSRSSSLIELIELGQIGGGAKSKSDRLSVTANCSLVIKKVTVEDVGRYFCQQYKSGQQQGLDALVYLSLVNSEDSIRATTKPTTTSEKIKTGTNTTASAINDASTELRGDTQTPTTKPTTTPEHSTAGTTTTGANEPSTNLQDMWWLFVVVAVVLVALLITVVVVIKRRRAKGNKSRMNGRVVSLKAVFYNKF
ncbi:hypothetical protein L3Q82_011367 [Scortum barcoo]|uniref:Uncharacterized protein n=1 Tax=Scortum barcoo TaxID=214431 RepID=A0ACB8W9R3_9TELE|nr:hypothetical protein L3Q82_011367 [Scortum barcoo]